MILSDRRRKLRTAGFLKWLKQKHCNPLKCRNCITRCLHGAWLDSGILIQGHYKIILNPTINSNMCIVELRSYALKVLDIVSYIHWSSSQEQSSWKKLPFFGMFYSFPGLNYTPVTKNTLHLKRTYGFIVGGFILVLFSIQLELNLGIDALWMDCICHVLTSSQAHNDNVELSNSLRGRK